MHKKSSYQVIENQKIAEGVWQMRLQGDTSFITAPGQFVNMALPGFFLRRPISICDYDSEVITLIYKVVGAGTLMMSQIKEGSILDMLVGLGNGFDTEVEMRQPLLIGGGVGVPPLYYLCKQLIKKGYKPAVILGFNSKRDVFYHREFSALVSDRLYITTIDGTMGVHGVVTDAIKQYNIDGDYSFSCGPLPMLRAVANLPIDGQLSFEERMGCGFGGCMGCTHQTKEGYKRICLEGPVLRKEEIIW